MSWSVPYDATGSIRRVAHCGNCPASKRRTSATSVSISSACILVAPIAVTLDELRQPQQPSFDVSAGVGDDQVLRPRAAVAADLPRSVDGPAEQRQTITRPGPAPHPAYRPTRPKLPAAALAMLH